jgi:hypothetical protein
MKRRTVAELHGRTTQNTAFFSVSLCFVFLNSFHVKKKIRRYPVHFPFQKKLLFNKRGRNTYVCFTYVSVKWWVKKWRTHCTGTLRDAPHKWFRNSVTRRGHHEVWFSVPDGEGEEHLWRQPCVLVCCCVVTSSYQLSKLVSTRFFIFFLGVGWDWVHLIRRPLFGLLYQLWIIDNDECGAVGGMRICKGNRSTRRKRVPFPLFPTQIPHDLTYVRTRVAIDQVTNLAWISLAA